MMVYSGRLAGRGEGSNFRFKPLLLPITSTFCIIPSAAIIQATVDFEKAGVEVVAHPQKAQVKRSWDNKRGEE